MPQGGGAERKNMTKGLNIDLKHYKVVRVAFNIEGWVEDEPTNWTDEMPENATQIGLDTPADYYMVAEWDEDLDNYRVFPNDEVYESWAEAAVKAKELETEYNAEEYRKKRMKE